MINFHKATQKGLVGLLVTDTEGQGIFLIGDMHKEITIRSTSLQQFSPTETEKVEVPDGPLRKSLRQMIEGGAEEFGLNSRFSELKTLMPHIFPWFFPEPPRKDPLGSVQGL